MAYLAKRLLEGDVFDCPICIDTLKDPKYLPCLHNFCENCLDTYIKDANEQDPQARSSSFHCPVCRSVVIPPNPHAPAHSWASQMPGNKLVTALLEDAPLHESEHFCDPCSVGDETSAASHWCEDCSEFLCKNCFTSHKRMKLTSRHKVFRADQVKQTTTKGVEVPEPCKVHKDRNLEVYCLKHKKMCCVLCLAENHRKCEYVRSLEVMATHMNVVGGAAALTRQLQNLMYQAESYRKYKEMVVENITERYNDLKSNMADLVEQAKKRLDELHFEFNESLDETYDIMKVKISVKQDRILRFQKTLENSVRLLEVVGKRASPKQLFIQVEKTRKQMSRQLQQIESFFRSDEDIEFKIDINDSLQNFASTIKSLGSVKIGIVPKEESKESQAQAEQFLTAGKELNESLWSVDDLFKQMGTMDFSLDALTESNMNRLKDMNDTGVTLDEFSNWFTGGAFLKDSRLLLCDNNNCALKLFNQFAVMEKVFKTEHRPWDCASGKKDDVFVSFGDQKFIGKYKVDKKDLVAVGKIKKTSGTWGIDVCQNYILTCREDGVDILNYEGRLLRTITKGGNNVFIAASKTGGLYFYTDFDDIVCRPIIGKQEKFRFSNPDLSGARGIAVDRSNNIYVTGIYSHNIFKISSDGRKSREIIPSLENIKEPYAMGLDRRGEKVFVTSYNEPVALTFFQLSKAWKF